MSDVHQSNLPTESKLFLGVIFIGLAPVWFVFFWVEILISIVYECGTYTNPLSKEIKMKPGNNNETFTLSRQNAIRLFVASGTVFKLMAPYFGIPRVIATLWFSMLASVTACFAIDKPMKKSMVHVLFNRPAVKAYICAFITTRLEFICRLHSFVSPYNLPAGEPERNCIVERYFDTFTMVVFVLFYIIVCFCHIELLLALVMPFLIEYFTGPTPKKISEILSFATLLSKFPLSSDKKLRVCKRQSLTRQISESTKVISDRSASGTIGIYTATNAIRAANKFHHSLNNKRHEKEAKRVNEPHQAVLNLSVIRGVLNKSGINAFGGKANPYVIVYYPYTPGTKDVVNPEYLYKSKPVYKGGNAPNFNWNDNKINIIEGKHDLLIEVVDKSDISNPDRLLLYKEVDIKEWIADKRFEGELKMNDAYSSEATFIHPDGKVTQDYVQIAAKITYSTRPDLVSQNSIRQSDIFVPSPSTLTAAHTPVPPRSDATPRSTAPSRFKVENEPLSLAHPDERSSSTLSRRGSDASIDIGQV